jgi:hypothetical protein
LTCHGPCLSPTFLETGFLSLRDSSPDQTLVVVVVVVVVVDGHYGPWSGSDEIFCNLSEHKVRGVLVCNYGPCSREPAAFEMQRHSFGLECSPAYSRRQGALFLPETGPHS